MRNSVKLMCLIIISLSIFSCSGDDLMEPVVPTCEETVNGLMLNEVQIIGSHNSYRQATDPGIMAFMNQATDLLPEGFDPDSWDYNNAPLLEQLNSYNIRSIELDVYRDPQGGLFYYRLGNAFIGENPDSGIDALKEPGLKIIHFPDFDYNTEFITFKGALNTLVQWSDDNPNHLPFYVLVEAKEDNPDAMLPGYGLTSTLDFRGGAIEEIEMELTEVFGSNPNKLIRPEDVTLSGMTLRESVEAKSWPSLENSRGKIFVILMAAEEVIEDYVSGNGLEDRMMFVFTDPDSDNAAFLNITDPEANLSLIQQYVERGFIVRTQADSDTYEARSGYSLRREAAFNSGAQIICTDYYRADPRHMGSADWTDYEVSFPMNQLSISNNTSIGSCEITE